MATQQTTTNKNIFELLSDQSDDDLQTVKQKGEKRVRPNKKKTEQSSTTAVGTTQDINENVNSKPKETSRGHKHPKDAKQTKGVSSEPHPQDRKSGTGRGKEMSKGGAGKGNWGNHNDDGKEIIEGEEEVQEQEEEEEVVFTLDEYLNNKAKSSVNLKAEQELDQKLLNQYIQKDGLQLHQVKAPIDDHFFKKAKNVKAKDFAPKMNTESSDLLGVRSGLQTYSEKPREENEERTQKPRREERQPRKEETTEQTTEGQQETTTEEKPSEENTNTSRGRGGRGGDRGRGGRGGRGGDRDGGRGGRGGRGGDRDGGRGGGRGGRGGDRGRGGRGGANVPRNNNSSSKVFVEDDSSFPTLG